MDHEETIEERNMEMQGRIQEMKGDTKEKKHHLGTFKEKINIKEAMKSLDHVFTFHLDGWMHILGTI